MSIFRCFHMKCKKSLIFALLIICLFSIAAVSASDVEADKSSNIQLGDDTIDNVVATEETSFNENTDVIASNEDDSSDAVSSEEENNQIHLSWGDEHSFDELQTIINQANESDEITLEHDYSFAVGGSTIKINKSLTINGNDHILDGCHLNKIFYIKDPSYKISVVLKNIKFVNGGELSSYGTYSNSVGGAISHEANVNRLHELTLMNCVFEENGAAEDGGAVYWTGGVLKLQNCTFRNNAVDKGHGGAVYFKSNVSAMDIIDCRFNQNRVKHGLGTDDILDPNFMDYYLYCYLLGKTLSGNPAKHLPSGGAVFIESTYNVDQFVLAYSPKLVNHVYNSVFENNQVGEVNEMCTAGGAIHTVGLLDVHDSTFNSNKAYDQYGGAILCNSYIRVYDSNFKDNVANSGGAISSFRIVKIENSRFEGNKHEVGTTMAESVAWGDLLSEIPGVGDIIGGLFSIFGFAGIEDSLVIPSMGGAVFSASNIDVNSCIFSNNYASEYGGALYAEVDVNVKDSQFTSNNAYRGDDELSQVMAWQGHNRDGGAIHSGRNAVIDNSNFIRNYARFEGGSVYCGDICDVSNSKFSYNSAADRGAAISAKIIGTVSNSTFTSNKLDMKSILGNLVLNHDGGAIYMYEGWSPRIDSCVFIGNSVLGDGGAIYADSSDVTLTVSNTRFAENVAVLDAGAIYCKGKINIYSSKFENNVANGENKLERSLGGAVNTKGDIYIENSEFNSNQARKNGGKGGAIYAHSGARVSIKGSWFKYNTAEDGGAIYADIIHDEIYNTVFIGNKATDGDGGAIYIKSPSWPKIIGCTFDGNTATDEGGAIYGWSGSELKIVDSKFYSNSAKNGGATYVYKIVEFSNNIFDGNKANKGDGGAIYADVINDDIYHSTFRHNQATGDDGGAIYINSASWPKIISCTFEENTAARYGGGIYTWRGSTQVKILDSKFIRNSAKEGGGAYISKFTDVLNTLFKENKATGGDGGGLYANDELQNPNMQYTTFESNTAANRGGGLYIDPFSSTLGLLRCNFYNNAAGQGGGAYVQHITEIKECAFIGNSATATKGDGGGIYINRASDFDLRWNRFENNHANNRGGGIYTDSKTTHITGMQFCTFVHNHAEKRDYNTNSNLRHGAGHSIFNSGYYPEYLGACWYGSNNPNFSEQLVEYKESANDIDHSPGDYYLKVGVSVNQQPVYYVGNAYVVTLYFIAPEGHGAFSPTDPFYHNAGGFYPSDDINFASFTMTRTNMGNIEAILVPNSSNLHVIHAYIDEADVSVGINVQDKTPSTVKIVSCDEVQYPNALKVTYNINPMSASTYVIRDSQGEIVKRGDLTDPNTAYINGLAPGSYSITINNTESWYNLPGSDTKTFNITKGNVNELSVVVNNRTYPDDVKCIVYASTDGEYNLTVNNATYVVTVRNGIGYINIGTLDHGTYDAVVSVVELDHYLPYSNSTEFVVYPSVMGSNFAIDINATEIEYLQTAVITNSLPQDATGNITYYLSNGTILGELPVSENLILPILEPGHYVIIANYSGDGYHAPDTDFIGLMVNKLDPEFTSGIVWYFEDGLVGLTDYHSIFLDDGTTDYICNILHPNATGTISYYFSDGTLLAEVPLSDMLEFNVMNWIYRNSLVKFFKIPVLLPGPYHITAYYSGDEHFKSANDTFYIETMYHDYYLTITETEYDHIYGQDVIVTPHLKDGGVGTITYYIDGGSTNLFFETDANEDLVLTNLDSGSYRIIAVYSGDGEHRRDISFCSFIVKPIDTGFELNITANETIYGENPTVLPILPQCNGNISYFLSDGTFLGETPVSENFTLPVFDAGTYIIIGKYSGDRNHLDATTYISLTVNQAQPSFEVSANESRIVYGTTTFATSALPENATGTISYYFGNGTFIGELPVNETLTLPVLNAGSYAIRGEYSGDKNFLNAIATARLTVTKAETEIFVEMLNTTYKSNEDLLITLKDINGNPVVGFDMIVQLNGFTTYTTDENGQVKVSTYGLDAETYDVSITFRSTKNYLNSSNATTVVINKAPTEITADMLSTTYMSNENLLVTLKDTYGNPVAGVNVTVDLNGNKNYTTDENGQIRVPTYGLAVKTYDVGIAFSGNGNYIGSSNATKAIINNYQYMAVFVKDDMNNPLRNAETTITVNGIIYKAKTDDEGYAKVLINMDEKANETNNKDSKDTSSGKTTTTKATPKLTAKKKTFKKAIKVKKYTVTLKVNGKALAKKTLYLKIKGKTFKAKTNAKGNAVFKIKKLSKKGKFKATVTFKGDKLYKKVTKKVQIVIK